MQRCKTASPLWICYRTVLWMHGPLRLKRLTVDLLEANELLDCLVCLIGLQTVWLLHQFMLFSTSVTIWWRPRDFHCPLSHLSDCSQKQCRALFPQGMEWCMCVRLRCISVILGPPQTMTFGMICTTQLRSPHCSCWKPTLVCAVTSATTSMNHAVHKYAGKMFNTPQNNCSHFTKASAGPWCWSRAGCVTPSGNVSNAERVCWAVLLLRLKYLPLWLRLQRCGGECIKLGGRLDGDRESNLRGFSSLTGPAIAEINHESNPRETGNGKQRYDQNIPLGASLTFFFNNRIKVLGEECLSAFNFVQV